MQRALRQRPRHPRVDRAEAQIVGIAAVERVGEQPADLGGRLVGGERAARARPWRRCTRRRCAGPASRAPARSDGPWRAPTRSCVARWLVMPTPSIVGSTGRAAAPRGRRRARVRRAGRRRTRPGRGTACRAATTGTRRATIVGVGCDDGGPQTGGADVDHENHQLLRSARSQALCVQSLAEQPADQAGARHRRQREQRREPVDVAAAHAA